MSARRLGASERRLARALVELMLKDPGRKDTLEGVALWWLRQQRVEETVDQVARVMEELVDRGLVLERQVGGRSVYGLDPGKVAEAERFLSEAGDE